MQWNSPWLEIKWSCSVSKEEARPQDGPVTTLHDNWVKWPRSIKSSVELKHCLWNNKSLLCVCFWNIWMQPEAGSGYASKGTVTSDLPVESCFPCGEMLQITQKHDHLNERSLNSSKYWNCKMVNGTFLCCQMEHFAHSLAAMHDAALTHPEQHRVQCVVQGHSDMETRGARDQTVGLPD